jgi:hypothetical protein
VRTLVRPSNAKIAAKKMKNLWFPLPDVSRSLGLGKDRGSEVLAHSHPSQYLIVSFVAMLVRSAILAMR